MKNFLPIIINDENETDEIFLLTYKWSKFIRSSGHATKRKPGGNLDDESLPPKNSQSMVHVYMYTPYIHVHCTCTFSLYYAYMYI